MGHPNYTTKSLSYTLQGPCLDYCVCFHYDRTYEDSGNFMVSTSRNPKPLLCRPRDSCGYPDGYLLSGPILPTLVSVYEEKGQVDSYNDDGPERVSLEGSYSP